MGKQKNPTRDEIARKNAMAKKVQEMPMNKDFLQATDENGNLKYPIVDKLVKYKMLDLERILDIMRQISAYVAQVRHHQNRIKRLYEQYEGDVKEHDEVGRLLSKEEIQLKIVSEKIAIPRDLSKIREYSVDKLLPLVDGERFTGEEYNKYILAVNKTVTEMGYELFPEKIELIFPSL